MKFNVESAFFNDIKIKIMWYFYVMTIVTKLFNLIVLFFILRYERLSRH